MARKKELGRPARPLPPRIEATPEAIAKAMFAMPVNYQWKYLEKEPKHQCGECQREVRYPEVLLESGLCQECARAAPACFASSSGHACRR